MCIRDSQYTVQLLLNVQGEVEYRITLADAHVGYRIGARTPNDVSLTHWNTKQHKVAATQCQTK